MKNILRILLLITFPLSLSAALTVSNGGGATNVTSSNAWITATITSTGAANPYLFSYWGASDGGTGTVAWAHTNAYGETSLGAYSAQITGLSNSTVYYFRSYASNSTATAWAIYSAMFITLTTPTSAPAPSTRAVSVDTTGTLKNPMNFFGVNSALMAAALTTYGYITNETGFLSWLGTNSYPHDNTGNWAGTWMNLTTNDVVKTNDSTYVQTVANANAAYPANDPSNFQAQINTKVSTNDLAMTNARPWDSPNYNSITNPPSIPSTNGFATTGEVAEAVSAYVPTNSAQFLSILSAMTNLVLPDSPTNYIVYDPLTRTLTACVTNVPAAMDMSLYATYAATNQISWGGYAFGVNPTTAVFQLAVDGGATPWESWYAGSNVDHQVRYVPSLGLGTNPPVSDWPAGTGSGDTSQWATNKAVRTIYWIETEIISNIVITGVGEDPNVEGVYSQTVNTVNFGAPVWSNGIYFLGGGGSVGDGICLSTNSVPAYAYWSRGAGVYNPVGQWTPHGTASGYVTGAVQYVTNTYTWTAGLNTTNKSWEIGKDGVILFSTTNTPTVNFGITSADAYRGDWGAAVSNDVNARVTAHVTNAANPHATTATQVGALSTNGGIMGGSIDFGLGKGTVMWGDYQLGLTNGYLSLWTDTGTIHQTWYADSNSLAHPLYIGGSLVIVSNNADYQNLLTNTVPLNTHALYNVQASGGNVVVSTLVGGNTTTFTVSTTNTLPLTGGTMAGNIDLKGNTMSNGAVSVSGLTITGLSGPGTVPVGSVQMYVGATAPGGWLLCDGTAVGTNVYPALFAVIGTTYGGATTNMNLPDFRGVFPKGAGTTSRTAGKDAATNSYAATLGTYYQDKEQGHGHSVKWSWGDCIWYPNGGGSSALTVPLGTIGSSPAAVAAYDEQSLTGYGAPRTGTSTEPQSLGINFIIKY